MPWNGAVRSMVLVMSYPSMSPDEVPRLSLLLMVRCCVVVDWLVW